MSEQEIKRNFGSKAEMEAYRAQLVEELHAHLRGLGSQFNQDIDPLVDALQQYAKENGGSMVVTGANVDGKFASSEVSDEDV